MSSNDDEIREAQKPTLIAWGYTIPQCIYHRNTARPKAAASSALPLMLLRSNHPFPTQLTPATPPDIFNHPLLTNWKSLSRYRTAFSCSPSSNYAITSEDYTHIQSGLEILLSIKMSIILNLGWLDDTKADLLIRPSIKAKDAASEKDQAWVVFKYEYASKT